MALQAQPPANDQFASPANITGSDGTLSGTTSDATTEFGEPSGYNTVWHRWTATANHWVKFDTFGSAFDTTLGVYVGHDAFLSQTIVTNNDCGIPLFEEQSVVAFSAVAGQTYMIRIGGNLSADSGAYVLNWTNLTGTPPSNDFSTNATAIAGAAGSTTGTTEYATAEAPEFETYQDPNSVWWRWTAPQTGFFTFDTSGSSFVTVFSIYQGTTVADMQVVLDPNYWPDTSFTFHATNGVLYYVRVAGLMGASGAVTLMWQPSPPPANNDFTNALPISGDLGTSHSYLASATIEPEEPLPNQGSIWWTYTATNAQQVTFNTDGRVPRKITAFAGTTLATLTPVALSTERSSTNLAGETYFSSTLTLCTYSNQPYFIRIDGAPVAAASLSWSSLPPQNDQFGSRAGALSGSSGETNSSNCGATVESTEPPGANTVWFRWKAAESGLIQFDTIGSPFDTVLDVYSGSVMWALYPVASNDDSGLPGAQEQSVVEFEAFAGQSYWIRVGSHTKDDVGAFVLRWGMPQRFLTSNDAFSAAFVITGISGSSAGSTYTATAEPGEPWNQFSYSATNTVWWKWIAPADTRIEFSTCASLYDTVVDLYTGESLEELVWLDSNDDSPCPTGINLTSRVAATVTNGQAIFIRVAGFGGQDGLVHLDWQPLPNPTNDAFVNATRIAGVSGHDLSHTYGATAEPWEPFYGHTESVWWRWECPQSGIYTFTALDTLPVSLSLCAYSGVNLENLVNLACGDIGEFSMVAISGETYHLRAAAPRKFVSLRWSQESVAISELANARRISNRVGSVSSNTLAGPGWQWFSWTAPQDMEVRFDTLGSDYDTRLWVVVAAPELDRLQYRLITNNNDIPYPDYRAQSRIHFSANAGRTYWVLVDGPAGATGTFNLNWQCAPARLDMQIVDGKPLLTWPAGYVLQAATSLDGPATLWTDLAMESGYVEEERITRFYRLVCR